MNLIYHIVLREDWERQATQPVYEASSLHTEGFIHLSKQEQVTGTLRRYYQNVPNLLLLHVDVDKLTHPLKFELSTNNELFPHLYGPLNKDAIVLIEQVNESDSSAISIQ